MLRAIFIVNIVFAGMCAVTLGYSGGSGTVSDPYKIATADDLVILANNTSHYTKYFKQTANINLSGSLFTGLKTTWNVPFAGSFDGCGYVISNFSVNDNSRNYVSFFGNIGSAGVVRRVALENVSVVTSGTNFTGGIAGWSNGLIEQCYVTGSVSGTNLVGGISGGLSGSTAIIRNCYTNCTATVSTGPCAGIAAQVTGSASVIKCYAAGAAVSPNWWAGIVAQSDGSIVSNGCFYNVSLTNTSLVGQGLTIEQMKNPAPFAASGWDFASENSNGTEQIWFMPSDSIPRLCINNRANTLFVFGGLEVPENGGGQYRSSLINNLGAVSDVTASSTWTLQGSSASISSAGYITTANVLNDVALIVKSQYQGLEDSLNITLKYAPIIGSIYIAAPATAAEQAATQLYCKAIWDNGTHNDVTSLAVWAENSDFATISGGLLTTVDVPVNKLVTVTASYQGFAANADVTIVTPYSGGYGTTEEPYRISAAEDFTALTGKIADYNKHFIVTNDIDLAGSGFAGIGADWNNPFRGIIDGQGHIVSNFTVQKLNTDLVSLVGVLAPEGVVKRLSLVGVDIDAQGGKFAAAIAGWCYGQIEQCFVGGEISGNLQAGGLCGGISSNTAIIKNSGAVCSVTTTDGTPGLLSAVANDNARIEKSFAIGIISQSGNWPPPIFYNDATMAVTGCFYNSEMTQWSPAGIGITTAMFDRREPFIDAGWDMIGEADNGSADIWFIGTEGYPQISLFNRTQLLRIIATDQISEGSSLQMKCVEMLEDGDSIDVTSQVSWSVDSQWASITEGGFFTAANVLADQIVNVTAATDGLSVTFPITVKYSGQVVQIQIEGPGSADQCSEVTYICRGIKDNGETIDLTNEVVWNIEPPYAHFMSNGLMITHDVPNDVTVRVWAVYDTLTAEKYVTVYDRFAAGGDGLPGTPYRISNTADLEAVNNNPQASYILANDINLYGKTYQRAIISPDTLHDRILDHAIYQGKPFTGDFEGNGHKIINFVINSGGNDYAGLFGFVGDGGSVRNLTLENITINGAVDYAGAVAGEVFYAAITDCVVTGSSISGNNYVGGIAGYSYHSAINGCRAAATINANDSAGGIVGENWAAVSRCSFDGNLNGNVGVGGVTGYNDGIISDCFTKGVVYGFGRVGGLVGDNWSQVLTSFSAASVNGANTAGPLVGINEYPMDSCFWNRDRYSGFTAGVGISTIQFSNVSTFLAAGWDFTGETANGNRDIWMMGSQGHPVLVTGTAVFDGGDGSALNPYLISTANQLISISRKPSAFYRLTSDINLGGMVYKTSLIPFFKGTLDGGRHTINSLTINGEGMLGLFGVLSDQAVISNMQMVNASVSGSGDYIGIIAGKMEDASVYNLNIGGTVGGGGSSRYVGGIAGCSSESIIMTSFNAAGINGGSDVGGICGAAANTQIILCYNIGHIDGINFVGGLSGSNWNSVYGKCYNAGIIEGSGNVGGFTGLNWDTVVSDCYNGGQVSGLYSCGGFSGANTFSSLYRVYSSGAVALSPGGSNNGGLIGMGIGGGYYGCFWDKETSSLTVSAGGSGKLTEQMMDEETYIAAGWDFVEETQNGTLDVWKIKEDSYPSIADLETQRQINITGATFVQEGSNSQYACIYIDEYGAVSDVTLQAQWAVSSGSSSITSGGLFSAGNVLEDMDVVITATYQGLSTEFEVEVGYVPVIERIYITAPQTVNENTQTELKCLKVWDNGEHIDVTLQAEWGAVPAAADVAGGDFTAHDVNIDTDVTVTASYQGYNAQAVIRIITPFKSGYGTQQQPYVISTAAELAELAGNITCYGKYFVLSNDIDLSGITFSGIGADWNNPFSGTFDGCGFKVKNFKVNTTGNLVSLFGNVGASGHIKRLGVTDVDIKVTSGWFTGGIAGWCSGLIEQCYVTGVITGDGLPGGITGGLSDSTGIIRNCYTNCVIGASSGPCGGIAADAMRSAAIVNCYTAGSITASWAGGILARSDNTVNISGCLYNSDNTLWSVGGLGVSGATLSKNTAFANAGWDIAGESANGSDELWYLNSSGVMTLRAYCKQRALVIYGVETINEWQTAGLVCRVITDSQIDDVTSSALWSVDGTASINHGQLTAGDVLEDEVITVRASFDSLSAVLSVKILYIPLITRIYITAPDYLNELTGAQLNCTAVQDNGDHINVTSQASWDDNMTEASVNAAGWFYCQDVEFDSDVMVHAAYGGFTAETAINIATPYYSGHGTAQSPYQISNSDELFELAAKPLDFNKYFLLTADVNLQGINFPGIGSDWTYPFTGTFDGGGHIVKGFTVSRSGNLTSFIGYIGAGGCVRRLGLVDVNIYSGGAFTGGIAGWCSGLIEQSFVKGTIYGNNLSGGICGGLSGSGGIIRNCYSDCVASVPWNACGGIAASASDYAVIDKCYAAGYVESPNWWGGVVANAAANVTVTGSFFNVNNVNWSAGGIGLTSYQMTVRSFYANAGWDFADESVNGIAEIWRTQAAASPILNWQKEYRSDFNRDGLVDVDDLEMFALHWLDDLSTMDIYPVGGGDGIVDIRDFCVFADNWQDAR